MVSKIIDVQNVPYPVIVKTKKCIIRFDRSRHQTVCSDAVVIEGFRLRVRYATIAHKYSLPVSRVSLTYVDCFEFVEKQTTDRNLV